MSNKIEFRQVGKSEKFNADINKILAAKDAEIERLQGIFNEWDSIREETYEKQCKLIKQNTRLEQKLAKLKRLILLTDDSVSDVTMNDLTTRQWLEFIKHYPEESGLPDRALAKLKGGV